MFFLSLSHITDLYNKKKQSNYIVITRAKKNTCEATGDSHEFSNVSQTVFYDWTNFGCVLRIHYKDDFQPDIEL